MEDKIKYWFIRLYEYTDTPDENECTTSLWSTNYHRHLIDEAILIANDRECAKKMSVEKFGEYPFALTKKNKVDGFKYFYLTESDKYWYDFHYKEFNYECSRCGKSHSAIGQREMKALQFSQMEDKGNEYTTYYFCSKECCEQTKKEKDDEFNKNFIAMDCHLLIGCEKTLRNLLGYIYKITNKHTGLCYVGQTKHSPVFRWYSHLKEDNHKFQRDNICDLTFEVLEVVTKGNNISEREQFYVDLYDCIDNGYNKLKVVKLNNSKKSKKSKTKGV